MPVQIAIDAAPAYELITSFTLFVNPTKAKQVHLGTKWAQEISEQLEPDFVEELKEFRNHCSLSILSLLIRLCPPDQRDASPFLDWLHTIPMHELLELASPYFTKSELEELEERRTQYATFLTKWNDQYFAQTIQEQPIMQKIMAEYEVAVSESSTMPVVEFIEYKTGGIIMDQDNELDLVVLVPSQHVRPMCLYSKYRSLVILIYSIAEDTPQPGYPSTSLLHLTKTLADESRLRILHFLADGPKRYIEIVQFTGLSKSVVHNHLINLRTSGLIQVHVSIDSTERYSLHPNAFTHLTTQLQAFIGSPS